MNTDDLIRTLSADTAASRSLTRTLWLGLVPSLATALLAVWAGLGFRPDLVQSFVNPASAARYLLAGALALTGLRIALALARPQERPQGRPLGRPLGRATALWPLTIVGGLAVALWIWAYVGTPAEARQMATVGKTISTCLISIPILSILPVAAILAMLRHGASTAPRLASIVAGLAGGGAAAAVYALHCTEDSPLFFITWYSLAIAAVTLASALIGPRLLRW